jgi:sugar phosphate isomerase/epimerase
MELTLACSTTSYEGVPIERALSGIAAAGFTHVVVGPAHGEKPVLELDAGEDGAAGLAAAAEKAGLKVLSLAPELAPLDDQSVDALATVLAQAAKLGASRVWVCGPDAFDEAGAPKDDAQWAREFDGFVPRLKDLAAKARELGVSLEVTTQPRLSGCNAELEKLYAAIGDLSSVAIAYNPGLVSYFTGINPVRDLEGSAARVGALCLRDHKGAIGEPTFPSLGGGDIDWFKVFEILAAREFAGAVIAEHLPGVSAEELDASAKTVHRFLTMMASQA